MTRWVAKTVKRLSKTLLINFYLKNESMKGFIKLTTAALALAAFASCSNDDLFGSANENLAKNELTVVLEDLNGNNGTSITRMAYTGANARIYQNGDAYRVYDDELHKYDNYTYKSATNKLTRDGESDVEEAKFLAFPASSVVTTKWVKENKSTELTMKIPATMTYEEVAGQTGTGYVSNLPMWGVAENNGDGITAQAHFLTSILKVKLTNALNHACQIKVEAWSDVAGTTAKNISGSATAILSEQNTPKAADEVTLGTPESADATNTITVTLPAENIKSQDSYIFIPLVAGYYGKVTISYNSGTVAAPTWNAIRSYYAKTFERGGAPYGSGNEKAFDVASGTINALNASIASAINSGATEVTGNEATNVSTADGKELIIPSSANDLTLNLKNFKATASEELSIAGGDFNKTLTINLSAVSTNIGTVNVVVPNGNVVLEGDWSGMGSTSLNIISAKNVTFGGAKDGTAITTSIPTTLDIKAEVSGTITVAEGATLAGTLTLPVNHLSKAVTVAGTVTGAMTINASEVSGSEATNVQIEAKGNVASLTVEGAANASTITVNGIVNGAITNKGKGTITLGGVAGSIVNNTNETPGKITINGAPNYKTAATSATSGSDYAKVATVDTKGDVEIALNAEGAAVGTSLTMVVEKTLTLTQGYVKNISVTTSGDKKATVALGTDNANYVNVVIDNTKNAVKVTGNTKWNGKAIGGGIPTGTASANAIKTNWEGYADAKTAVYTALGLVKNATQFTLANDINLGGEAWTPVTSAGAIDGGGKTISNLKVKAIDKKANKDDGLGLFGSLGHDVSNLTIDGVTIEQGLAEAKGCSNVGALAGQTSANVTLTGVTIKNVNIAVTGVDKTAGADAGAQAIGGVIGLAGGSVIMTGVQVSGTNTIKGYCKMGGLIGDAVGQVVTIQKKAAATAPTTTADVKSAVSGITFTSNHNSASTTPAVDKNYLSVGNFIGTATGAAQITITDADNIEANKLTYDYKTAYSGYASYIEGVNFYNYVFGQGLIGYCGDAALATDPKINGNTYDIQTTKAAYDALTGTNKSLYYINK